MMHSRKITYPTTLLAAVVGSGLGLNAARAAEIVNDVNALDWTYTNSASESSTGAGSLTIQTSKNSDLYASLPAAYQLADGQTMTVTLTVQLDYIPADTSSTMDISLSDSTTGATGGTLHDSTYNFKVQLNPVTTGNGIQFAEGNDTNLGKFNEATAWGTNQHTITFQVQNAAPDMTLLVSSPTLSPTQRSADNDVTPVQTATFDTVSIEFRGNAWNENGTSGGVKATITNFSIETTGSAVPEPASLGLLSIGALLLARHR